MKKRPQKTATSTALVPARAAAARPVRLPRPAPEPAEPTARTLSVRLPMRIKGKTPGARINEWHKLAVVSGKASIAASIMAGWELAQARAACDHGQWLAWLQKNTALSDETARRYLTVFAQTVGAARAALPKPVPLEVQPTMAELEGACADVEAKSLTALYGQLRLLKRNPKHGGFRKGAGRHRNPDPGSEEAVAAELDDAVQTSAILWAAVRGALDELVRLDAEENFLSHLPDDHLSEAAAVLSDLARKAGEILKSRLG